MSALSAAVFSFIFLCTMTKQRCCFFRCHGGYRGGEEKCCNYFFYLVHGSLLVATIFFGLFVVIDESEGLPYVFVYVREASVTAAKRICSDRWVRSDGAPVL